MKTIFLTLFVSTSLFVWNIQNVFAVETMTSDDLKEAINPGSNILSGNANSLSGESFLDYVLAYVRDSIFLLLWLIAVWVFLYIWARLIMARGNPEELKKALTSFIYAAIGIFTVALAWALVRIIAGLDF